MTNFLLRLIVLQLLTAVLASACAGATGPGQLSTPSPSAPTQEDEMPKDPPLPTLRSPGLQALIEKAEEDLAQRLSMEMAQISLIKAEDVVWADSSLGCPQSGTVYIQVLTSGFLIHLEAAGKVYEYHTDFNEQAILCEAPRTPIFPVKPGDIQDGQPWMP
jgi:hypothetical protein